MVPFKGRTVTRQGEKKAEKAEKMLFLLIIKIVFDGILKAKDAIKRSAGKVKRNQMRSSDAVLTSEIRPDPGGVVESVSHHGGHIQRNLPWQGKCACP